ncbi:MAG: WYL domain-containing protein [Lachnospiraceae bacterium]|nr:WYL domain-containing protein [Lachnospiraceae bacterium]
MSSRIVEPVQLLFKEYTWYVRGFCRERRDFRVFKVFRMKRVEVMEETFTPKAEVERKQEEPKNNPPDDNRTHIEMVIDKKEAYRIYDRFEENELEVLENGDFLVHMDCSLDDWVYGLILNFGSSATVLSPESVRTELQRRLQKMLENYK